MSSPPPTAVPTADQADHPADQADHVTGQADHVTGQADHVTGQAGAAALVWQGMRTLVLERYDRRREVCEALGMSFIRAKALRQLAAGPLTMRQLAARLSTDPPYTTLVVDDLQRRGLVERSTHPTDRRAKVVTATAEGARIAEVAGRILNQPPLPVLRLAPADLAALERIVTTLLATADDADPG